MGKHDSPFSQRTKIHGFFNRLIPASCRQCRLVTNTDYHAFTFASSSSSRDPLHITSPHLTASRVTLHCIASFHVIVFLSHLFFTSASLAPLQLLLLKGGRLRRPALNPVRDRQVVHGSQRVGEIG